MSATIKKQQLDLSNIPLLKLVVESVSANFSGSDLINGKIAYNSTTHNLITVIAGSFYEILSNKDLAVGTDLASATTKKLIDASLVASSGDTPSHPDRAIPTYQKVIDEINAKMTGAFIFQGSIANGANLTTNSTGNTYLDGSNSVEKGDTFRMAADGSITVSDGSISLKEGDTITIINDKADGSILKADIDIVGRDSLKSIDVAFDNTGSNLSDSNVESAIKSLNSKFASGFFSVNNQSLSANTALTITHNLDSTSISIFARPNGSASSFIEYQASSLTNNACDLTLAVTGSYDIIIRKLDNS
tara:strand:- start:790 stop:1701 length:912 start_codon:yes stop_codon:yes gene_type:complete